MVPSGVITVPAKMLQEAVAVAIPSDLRRSWRKKSWPVSIVLDRKLRLLHIIESRHELAGYDLPLTGTWPERVQVDGRAFRHVVETYAPNEILELMAYPDRIEIKCGRSPFSMPRLDAPGREAIETRPIPRDKRHKGPVKIKDEPFHGRVELNDTWDFSARMPVPHHRFPDSQLPSGSNRNANEHDPATPPTEPNNTDGTTKSKR
jgi:hypothetical protein